LEYEELKMGFKFTTLTWTNIQKILSYFDTVASYIKTSSKIETTNTSADSIKTAGGLSVGGDITSTTGLICSTTGGGLFSNTTDGSDSKRIDISGGGAWGKDRGACIRLFGDDYGSNVSGVMQFNCGTNGYYGIMNSLNIIQIELTDLLLNLKLGKFQVDNTSADAIYSKGGVKADKGFFFPTSDPGIAGAWWDNAGTLTKSSG